MDKIRTRYTGVRYRESRTRKQRNGAPDRYFFIRIKINGLLKEEGIGWASEGWNPEKAYLMRAQFKHAQMTGPNPKSLTEMKAGSEERARQEAEAEEMPPLTLAEFFKLHYMPRAKREKRSWLTDENRIAKLINPALGHLPFLAVKKTDIQKFVDGLVDAGAAPSTVRQYMCIVRRAYNMAAEILIDDKPIFAGTNPAKGVRLPAVRNARERFLTGDEVEKLISAAAKLPRRDLHNAIILSLNTGLRLGELRRLTWLDVDLHSGILTVREEAQRKPGGKVPINAAAKEIFLARQALAEASPADLVFPPLWGRGLRGNMSRLFAGLVEKLGFNKGLAKDDRQRRVVFHTLRHTFASWLALAGVDIYRIKTLMRHKTLEMTMRYAHLIPDATHEAVHKLAPPAAKG